MGTTKVRDAMTPNPIEVPKTATLHEVARQMKSANVGAILVRDNGSVCGIVTDRDITVRGIAEGMDPTTTTVIEVCSGDLTTLTPDDPLDKAVKFAREKALRRFPVLEGGKPVGIVSLGDLAMEKDPDSALAAISEAPPNN